MVFRKGHTLKMTSLPKLNKNTRIKRVQNWDKYVYYKVRFREWNIYEVNILYDWLTKT